MDALRIVDVLLALLFAGFGWWLKTVWDSHKKLEEKHHTLEATLPKEYVRKSDWDRATDRVTNAIDEMREFMEKRFDELRREMTNKVDKDNGR